MAPKKNLNPKVGLQLFYTKGNHYHYPKIILMRAVTSLTLTTQPQLMSQLSLQIYVTHSTL